MSPPADHVAPHLRFTSFFFFFLLPILLHSRSSCSPLIRRALEEEVAKISPHTVTTLSSSVFDTVLASQQFHQADYTRTEGPTYIYMPDAEIHQETFHQQKGRRRRSCITRIITPLFGQDAICLTLWLLPPSFMLSSFIFWGARKTL